MSNIAQRRADAARGNAVIEALARLWPECFSVNEGRRWPLAVGICDEIIKQMEPAIKAGRISRRDITLALQRYCGSPRYLKRCYEGADRVGLNGRPHGNVNAEQAAHAQRLLERRRRRKAARAAAAQRIAEQGLGAVS